METINYTTLRSNLASVLDQVNDDRHPVMVTRQKGQPAVLLSLDDYRSLEETAYLLKSPENAKRLHRAVRQLENDQGSKMGSQ
jgi:antitoxin YefM